jgi:sorting nexin-1/2
LTNQVQEEEKNVAYCKAEYEKVAAVVDAEMARFQREKLADFKQMVVNFVTIQLECSQRIQATWQGLLPQLEAIEPPPPPGPPLS